MDEKDLRDWIKSAEKAGYRIVPFAKILGICRRQLERATRRRFDLSPRRWLDDLRLKRAKEMLKQKTTVNEVAVKLGFKQFSHFSRKFKIYHGLAPKHFLVRLKKQPATSAAVREMAGRSPSNCVRV